MAFHALWSGTEQNQQNHIHLGISKRKNTHHTSSQFLHLINLFSLQSMPFVQENETQST